jgi:hypothetical protein
MDADPCFYAVIPCVMVKPIVWALTAIWLPLTVRAIISRSWLIMWASAAVTVAACLTVPFSFGPLLFFVTCLQLAVAIAWREEADLPSGILFLIVSVFLYLLTIGGLALFHAKELWIAAYPAAFAVGSLALFQSSPYKRGMRP